MTPDYAAVRPDWTVDEALAHVRAKGMDSETINVAYVTDGRWKLLGVLGLRKLIRAAVREDQGHHGRNGCPHRRVRRPGEGRRAHLPDTTSRLSPSWTRDTCSGS